MGESKVLESGVSVVICCYNSGWIIARCIDALKSQRLPDGFHWEIVLVDNNCTDDTVDVAEECMQGSGIDFRVVEEDNPGLVNARKKGIALAKYKYAIYCDDDNLLCPEYVGTIYRILETNPSIGAVGGKGIPEFECEPEPYVLTHLEGYAIGSQKGHMNWLFGAGMALRTELAQDVYANQKLYLVGRKGGELLAGDDTELAYSIVLRGYMTYPTDDISYIHVLKASRLKEDYCRKMFAGFAKTQPPLSVMRLVLENERFLPIVRYYVRLHLSVIKNKLLFWHTNASSTYLACSKEIENMRSWGMFNLFRIYREWKRIRSSI